jgi:multicomponent Na+:H+ antiporter subunit B
MRSFLLSKVAQLLLPITIVFSLYLLIRGHNAPGGGFAAGLVASLALVIQAFAFGFRWIHDQLRAMLRPAFWLGLVIVLVTGLLPTLTGEPFLTHHHLELGLGAARLSLSTTLLFDVGVYVVVVGTTSVVLSRMAGGGEA